MAKYAIIFTLLLALAYSHNASAAIEPELTADYWLSEYLRMEAGYRSQWHDEYSPCVALHLRDAAVLTWRDARYSLPSYLDMYQWSGDPVWLGYFVERAEQILSYRSDPNGDGLWGWYTERGGENIVLDMGIAGALVKFANVAGHLYPAQAAEYRAVGEYIVAKWAKNWIGHTYTGVVSTGTIPPEGLPYNQVAVMGLLHHELGHAAHVKAIAGTLRSAMRPGPAGGLIWDYAPYNHRRVEDINHAGQVVSFAALAMPDIAPALIPSMLGVWRGGGDFAWKLDGSGQVEPPFVPYYRHMELGTALYEAVAAQWLYLLDRDEAACRPGSYLSVPSLVLLHQFPQQRIWLPVVWR